MSMHVARAYLKLRKILASNYATRFLPARFARAKALTWFCFAHEGGD